MMLVSPRPSPASLPQASGPPRPTAVWRFGLVGASVAFGAACASSPAEKADTTAAGPVDRPALAAFPTAELIDASGHLAIPADLLPHGATPVPVDHVAWRTGFSPVQTTVLSTEVPIDPASLPPPVGTGATDGVVLVDLTAGTVVPSLVELDAWPDNPEVPRLLVRPLQPLPVGHRVAVSVSGQLAAADGSPYGGPHWFEEALTGRSVDGGPADHYPDLAADLQALGLPEPVLAVDFPIGEGRTPLLSIMEALDTPTEWEWLRVVDADDDPSLPEGTWIQAEGRFTTADWLVDDGAFEVDASGVPALQGSTEADLFLFIPDTVRDADPGTVPVWIFGHGIFSHPKNYLGLDDDPSGVIEVARAAGAIVLATTWRGLTRDDIAVAAAVGNDFGRLPTLTDKLAQGVANTAALARLVASGPLLDDPVFAGLPDPAVLRYYGISLGGIEGATLFAVDDTLPHGVFHVGGSSWSTMLERSSNWSQFEVLMEGSVPSPADRQVLYAASQLYWDVADPALHADALASRSVLWQGSVGDEQVPNLTTDLVAGAAGATLLGPSPRLAAGWTEAEGPVSGPAVAWFDPLVGEPPVENRPAEVSGAHSLPRLWPGQHAQTLRFLDPSDPGVVEHTCGTAPCTADNPG